MASLFQKIYQYKQSGKLRHQQENFLTEIFAHCLEFDIEFRTKFLQLIDYNKTYHTFECLTQVHINKLIKPDVQIKLDNDLLIFIECKIGSPQGKGQLKKYYSFLNKIKGNYLIYLTKGPEKVLDKDIFEENFKHRRWYQIFELSKDSSNQITNELAKYLQLHHMNKSIIPLTNANLSAIADIKDSIEKMDSFLTHLEHLLKDYTDEKILPPQINHLIKFGSYMLTTDFAGGKLLTGFYQWEDEMKVFIQIEMALNDKNWKKNDKFLKSIEWESEEGDQDDIHWYNEKKLSSFIIDEIFEENMAFDFLEIELKKIAHLKNRGSNYL